MFHRAFALLGAASLLFVPIVRGFGVTVSGTKFIIDTSGGLVFTGEQYSHLMFVFHGLLSSVVESTSGDITSLVYNGVETQATDKHSHIASGIGATCTQVRPFSVFHLDA